MTLSDPSVDELIGAVGVHTAAINRIWATLASASVLTVSVSVEAGAISFFGIDMRPEFFFPMVAIFSSILNVHLCVETIQCVRSSDHLNGYLQIRNGGRNFLKIRGAEVSVSDVVHSRYISSFVRIHPVTRVFEDYIGVKSYGLLRRLLNLVMVLFPYVGICYALFASTKYAYGAWLLVVIPAILLSVYSSVALIIKLEAFTRHSE